MLLFINIKEFNMYDKPNFRWESIMQLHKDKWYLESSWYTIIFFFKDELEQSEIKGVFPKLGDEPRLVCFNIMQ